MPDVAVVIGNYQGERLLADCLASLETQTLKPSEVLVVDADNDVALDGRCIELLAEQDRSPSRLALAAMTMPAPTRVAVGAARSRRLHHNLRILRVTAAMDFKLKYAGSALGYVWSVIKPLALFTMLYLVFAKLFRLGDISPYYPLALLIGIVLYTFFVDATSLAMSSIVARETLIRKLSFPRLVIPTSTTLAAAITFGVNLVVVGVFVAWNQIPPRPNWVLLVPLLLEFYVFILGVSLVLATLFVRFRDIGQIWELAATLILYATPIIYPVGFLPEWARTIAFLNPMTQILQDVRAIVLYQDIAPNLITANDAFNSSAGRLDPDRDHPGCLRPRHLDIQEAGTVVRGTRMTRAAVEVVGVSKTFRLPHEERTTFKEHFLHPFHRVTYETQRALDDVSFSIERGEFFGIIGPNGSGKSTLLKILAGIYRADSGSVRINGLLSPFIELGVGFNPELNARDNVRINGTLLGLSRRELNARFDEIIALRRARTVRRPEAQELLVRHASPPRLLDCDPGRRSTSCSSTRYSPSATKASRRSASGRSSASAREGKTIVLVTHGLDILDEFADRALQFESGRIRSIGPPADVIAEYREHVAAGHQS